MKLGPRPAGERWTAEDDALLLALIESPCVLARRSPPECRRAADHRFFAFS
jgi:hypothetical protein